MSSSGNPRSQESIAATAIALDWTFTSLAIIIVCLRLYTRSFLIKALGLEDLAVFAGIIFSILYSVLIVVQTHYGLGRHWDTLTDEQRTGLLRSFYPSIIFYQLTISSAKISICLQYSRIAANKFQRAVLYIMLGIITAYCTWTTLSAILMCTPPAHFWDPTVEGHCLDELKLWFTNAGLNIATDTAMLLIPIPILLKLVLPKRQKIILGFIMSLGGFVTIISIVRLHSIYLITISDDVSWTNIAAGYWSGIESNLALICASLPALRPLVSRYLPKVLGSYSNRTRADSRYTGVKSQIDNTTQSSSPGTRSNSDIEANKTGYFQGREVKNINVVIGTEKELDPAGNQNDGISDGASDKTSDGTSDRNPASS